MTEENMENQSEMLIERMESEFGLLDKLRNSLTVMEIAEVKSKATTFEKNKRLLELIYENNKQQDLTRALTDTHQTHLVNWVQGNGEYRVEFGLDWPLNKKETEILHDNLETLIDIIDPCELVGLLFSKKVINKRQMDFIQSKRPKYEQNEELLNILRRCSLTAYYFTIDCLRASNQGHIADILEGNGAVVPVHTNLDADQLDEKEIQIVSEMANLLLQNNLPEDRTSLMLQELQIKIIAARRGSSIVLYIYCKTMKELIYLCEVINKKELNNRIENLFNALLHDMSTRVIDLYIVETEINKAKKFFEREESRDKHFDEEILRLREQIRHEPMQERTPGEVSSNEKEEIIPQRMDIIGSNPSLEILKKKFRNQLLRASLYDIFFGTGKTHLIPEKPWLFVYDGKNTFTLEMDLDCSTVADLFEEVVNSYGLQLDPKQHLRIIFADKELKFSRKKRLSEYGIISHSTIGVIFRLPDAEPASSATTVAPIVTRRKPHKIREPDNAGKVEKDERRPELRRWPGKIELTNCHPDFLDDELSSDLYRAIMPCGHVIGSESMRLYVKNAIDNGTVKVLCPYRDETLLHPPNRCPAVWDYTLVRHVTCFTTEELHYTEKMMATNFVGKEKTSLTCPGCFIWCSPTDPKLLRLRCSLCTTTTGKEFLFCRHCLGKWRASNDESCGNSGCNSIDAKLDILRNAPVTQLYGGTWPTIRACPRCGILTRYLGQCSQMHCQSCGHYYCFLCLKGAKSKAELECIPYDSDCQRAPLQMKIPQWDGYISD